MRITKLSKYTLKITLTADDAEKLGDNMISGLIDVLERALGLRLSGERLYAEVFGQSGGYIVYLSSANEITEKRELVAVIELSLSELLEAAKALLPYSEKLQSSLYFKEPNRYLLVLKPNDPAAAKAVKNAARRCKGSLDPAKACFAMEHFRELCQTQAIEKAAGVFMKN